MRAVSAGDAAARSRRTGPLASLRLVEFAGIGPAPFAAMLLADMGADIVRIDRPDFSGADARDITLRSRQVVAADLKDAAQREDVLRLLQSADGLIEGFRPGVMERLGLGPEAVWERNPRLVYGRITGWGQEGPLAAAAGHDINYIALPGALAAIGPSAGVPVPPLNLVGDYGVGALYIALGVLAAVIEARVSGRGQVVDAAMCDGAASMLSIFFTLKAKAQWEEARGANLLDGGAPFYRTYACADGRHIALGALEPQFYETLCRLAGLDDPLFRDRGDKRNWAELTAKMERVFRAKTRDEWCAILEGSDACFAPVLTMSEAPDHPHLAARQTFAAIDGVLQPAPAPRFSRTPSAVQSPPAAAPASLKDLIAAWQRPVDAPAGVP
ncbi:MAG TPA: CaiB/BaiF CoA-transferase family protein [Xanthobacteraceae bacterium]|nr:CaiB/BaiF CoA-transferase family protein [Xanthobacteraceae bacterium]